MKRTRIGGLVAATMLAASLTVLPTSAVALDATVTSTATPLDSYGVGDGWIQTGLTCNVSPASTYANENQIPLSSSAVIKTQDTSLNTALTKDSPSLMRAWGGLDGSNIVAYRSVTPGAVTFDANGYAVWDFNQVQADATGAKTLTVEKNSCSTVGASGGTMLTRDTYSVVLREDPTGQVHLSSSFQNTLIPVDEFDLVTKCDNPYTVSQVDMDQHFASTKDLAFAPGYYDQGCHRADRSVERHLVI